jgi:hypothetical protein
MLVDALLFQGYIQHFLVCPPFQTILLALTQLYAEAKFE